jgi:hypothetical protein
MFTFMLEAFSLREWPLPSVPYDLILILLYQYAEGSSWGVGEIFLGRFGGASW